jgi:hypothetical protein
MNERAQLERFSRRGYGTKKGVAFLFLYLNPKRSMYSNHIKNVDPGHLPLKYCCNGQSVSHHPTRKTASKSVN